MPRAHLLLALLLAGGALLPTANATIDTCTQLATVSAPLPVMDLLTATGRTAYMDGSCWGEGVVGGSWPGLATCAGAHIHVVESTYCGIMVDPGESVTCTWVGSSGRVDGIVVGFDLDDNGHIWHHADGEHSWRVPSSLPRMDVITGPLLPAGPILRPVLGSGTYVITNEWPEPGRVIAYPLTFGPTQSTGSAHIGCA